MAGWRRLGFGELAYLLPALCLAVLGALRLAGPGLVASADGELQLWRAFALDRAIQQGLIFPRVVPDLLFGYGYPLFNYYPPAASYLVVALHWLGLGYLAALNAAYALSFPVAALGMYLLARVGSGRVSVEKSTARAAALLAAVSYVLAPYFLINVYVRGALGEALALALFPFLALVARGTASRGGSRDVAGFALLAALLVLTHAPSAIFLIPVAVIYAVVDGRAQLRPAPWSRIALLGVALAFGLGLSAFFWLPAWLDRGHVAAQNLRSGFYDVHRNFLSWDALFARGLVYPPSGPGLPIPPRLGLPQALLIVASSTLLVRSARRWVASFWLAALGLALFLVTPGSAPIWDALPLLASLSFPWRLFGLVAAVVALLGALFVRALPARLATAVALLLAVSVAATSLPALAMPRLTLTEEAITLENYWRFEFRTGMVGTTSANEYLPVGLRAGSYQLARVPEPPADQSAGMLASTLVQLLEYRPLAMRLRVSGERSTSILAHAVFFPGWRAEIDGVPAASYPSTPLGLVTLDVPAGEHEVAIRYEASDAASTGTAISLALMLLGLAALAVRGFTLRAPRTARAPASHSNAMIVAPALAVVVVSVWALVWRPGADDRLLRPSSNGLLSDGVQLLGWRGPALGQGEIGLELYWLARHAIRDNEVVVAELRDARGQTAARWEGQISGGYSPSARWVAGEVVADHHDLPTRGVDPGSYTLAVALRERAATMALGTVDIAATAAPMSQEMPAPLLRTREGLSLLDYRLMLPDGMARRGQELGIVLRWRASAVMSRNYTILLHLLDERGERRAGQDAQPDEGRLPTLLWRQGEVVEDVHRVGIPGDLPPGRYSLVVGAYVRPEMERLALQDAKGADIGDHATLGTVEVR